MKIKRYDATNGWVLDYPEVSVSSIVVSNPLSASSTTFLRGDGQWATPSGTAFNGGTITSNLRIESGSFASLILDRGTTGSGSVVQFENNNGIIGGIGAYGDDGLQFRTTDGTQMVINASNNVGIGNTSPVNKLDVSGAASISNGLRLGSTGSGEGIFRHNPGTGNQGIAISTGAFSSSGIKFFVEHTSDGGGVGIGTTTPSELLEVEGSGTTRLAVTSTGGATLKLKAASGNAYISTSTNDNIIFQINDTSQHIFNTAGNVGIGTTSPGSKLDVNGNMQASRYYDRGNTSYYVDPASTSIINQLQVGLTGADYLTLLGTNSLQFDRDGTSYIDQKGTGDLAFRFGSGYTTRMTLTNDGKLGIGDTTPSYTLEVAGDMAVNKIFDRNNGSYYLDPASTSVMNAVQFQTLQSNKTSYGEPSSENFYRLKIQNQGGTHNDVGLGQTASGNLGYNVTAANAHIFYEGTNGEIARLQPSGLALNHSGTGTVDSKAITFTSQFNSTDVSRDLKTNSGGELLFNGNALATESYVDTEIASLVDTAPEALNTLNELAAALGDDENFSTTMTNSLAGKLNLTGGTLTGTLTSRAIAMQNYNLTQVGALQFNDPGPNEGIDWSGGNFKIYESPNDLSTNSAGNLQFVSGGQRRLTVQTDGTVYVPGTLKAEKVEIEGALFDVETNSLRMPLVKGGHYNSDTSSVTGAISITLPSGTYANATMMNFFVDVFDYAGGSDGESFTLHIGGYNYTDGTWHNVFANLISGRTDRFFTVRFNYDSTNSANIIYIAETTSNWAYPKVTVRDFSAGFSGADDADWYTNSFTVGITSTMFGTTNISKTAENVASNSLQLGGVNASSYLRSDADDNYNGTLSLGSTSTIKLPNSASYGIRTSTGHRVIDSIDATLRIGDADKHTLITLHGEGSDDFKVYYGGTHYQIWHEGNDGNGSGLSADNLRGYVPQESASANSIAKRDGNGDLKVNDLIIEHNGTGTSADSHAVRFTARAISTDFTRDLYMDDEANLLFGTDTIFHSGNDGSASGLHADLLDGQQGSYYLDYNNFTNTPSAGGEYDWEYVTVVKDSNTLTYSDMDDANYDYKFVIHCQATATEDVSQPYIRINADSANEYSYQYQSVTQTSETGESAVNAGDALASLIYTGADLSSYSNGGSSFSTVHTAEVIVQHSPWSTYPGNYTLVLRGWAQTHYVSQSGNSYDGMVQSTFVGTKDNLYGVTGENHRFDYTHNIAGSSTNYRIMRVYRRDKK